MMHRLMWVVLWMLAALAVSGCEREGPAERAGRQIDEAVEKAGEKIEKAADKTAQAVEDAGDKMQKRTQ